ncbi:MAG: hypothetical protein ACON5G_08990 [Pirellulaceae bacterium]
MQLINHPELAEKALEHASDITKIGMRGLFRIPSVDIASHSTTNLAEVLSKQGGTRTSSVSRGKYRVGKLHAEKGVRQGVRNASISSITPTLLATIWDDVDEVEGSNVIQIVVDYLETKRSEIIDVGQ